MRREVSSAATDLRVYELIRDQHLGQGGFAMEAVWQLWSAGKLLPTISVLAVVAQYSLPRTISSNKFRSIRQVTHYRHTQLELINAERLMACPYLSSLPLTTTTHHHHERYQKKTNGEDEQILPRDWQDTGSGLTSGTATIRPYSGSFGAF